MPRCARLTCCTAFGRTHRSWCLFVWLFTSGMRSVGGFRRFDVERFKRPRHLRSRSDQSRRKPESALAHPASHKGEIHHEHNRGQVSDQLISRARPLNQLTQSDQRLNQKRAGNEHHAERDLPPIPKPAAVAAASVEKTKKKFSHTSLVPARSDSAHRVP